MDDVAALFDYLEPEGDERAVLSLLLERDDGGHHWLVLGSLILGPEAIAADNWTRWMLDHGVNPMTLVEHAGADYSVRHKEHVVVRTVADIPTATVWVDELVRTGRAPSIGVAPSMFADLKGPSAPIRVSPRLGTAASSHVRRCVRAAVGFHFHGDGIDSSQEPATVWDDNGQHYINPPLAAGLHARSGEPGGLVLARLERRAWFNELRGSDGLKTFDCYIGLERNRVSVDELAVTIDEWVDGELAHSQRLALEDIDVEHVRSEPLITVRLPTLGTRVNRTIRLHDRNGAFLDGSEDQFVITETINIALRVVGPRQSLDEPDAHEESFSVGTAHPQPTLVGRADAVRRVQAEYGELYSAGAGRILVPAGADLRTLMRTRLRDARTKLQVVDRYFGKSLADWSMLDDVAVPTEVLLSTSSTPPPPRPGRTVRRLPGKPPPFHGRAYLWEGGGVAVDASPDGFGHAPIVITPLNAAVSASYRAAFDGWWSLATPPA